MKVFEIIKEDLEFNINTIKQRAKDTKIIAVVKGNAYGLGLKEFSTFLVDHGINDLAVSSVEEAIELASYGLEANILCLEATPIEKELEMLLDKNVVITIGNYETAITLNNIAKNKNKKAHVHIKIDTGFTRYGFSYTQKAEVLNTIQKGTSLFVDGVFSHFSYAYSKKEEYTKKQFEKFITVKNFLEKNNINIPMYHICNSSAFLKYDNMFLDAVRIGSAFLGRISIENKMGLKKIGTLKSNVVEIRQVSRKTPIGYSNSVILKKDSDIAIVPVGYADGFHVGVKNDTFKCIDKIRIIKNSIESIFKDDRVYVSINNKKYLVVGKIGMNHIAVDVTGGNIKIADEVKLDVSPILVNSKIRREYI